MCTWALQWSIWKPSMMFELVILHTRWREHFLLIGIDANFERSWWLWFSKVRIATASAKPTIQFRQYQTPVCNGFQKIVACFRVDWLAYLVCSNLLFQLQLYIMIINYNWVSIIPPIRFTFQTNNNSKVAKTSSFDHKFQHETITKNYFTAFTSLLTFKYIIYKFSGFITFIFVMRVFPSPPSICQFISSTPHPPINFSIHFIFKFKI